MYDMSFEMSPNMLNIFNVISMPRIESSVSNEKVYRSMNLLKAIYFYHFAPERSPRECHYPQSVYYIRDFITKLRFYCRVHVTGCGNNISTSQRVCSPRGVPEFVRSKSFVKSLVSPDGIIPR